MLDSISRADEHRQYLADRDRLANLFVSDRFAFELERKRIPNEAIANLGICNSHEKTCRIIRSERGHQLDPKIVDSFLRQEDVWRSVMDTFQDRNHSGDHKNLKD